MPCGLRKGCDGGAGNERLKQKGGGEVQQNSDQRCSASEGRKAPFELYLKWEEKGGERNVAEGGEEAHWNRRQRNKGVELIGVNTQHKAEKLVRSLQRVLDVWKKQKPVLTVSAAVPASWFCTLQVLPPSPYAFPKVHCGVSQLVTPPAVDAVWTQES